MEWKENKCTSPSGKIVSESIQEFLRALTEHVNIILGHLQGSAMLVSHMKC